MGRSRDPVCKERPGEVLAWLEEAEQVQKAKLVATDLSPVGVGVKEAHWHRDETASGTSKLPGQFRDLGLPFAIEDMS